METWNTSVNELIQVFRTALVTLLPSMEAARIAWKEGEAYDDWDEIAQTLYRNIVARSLQFAGDRNVPLDDVVPPYNMRLSSYQDRSVILVSGSQLSEAAVFVGLSSLDNAFDTVDCVHVDDAGNAAAELVRQPFESVGFSFASRIGSLKVVTELSVDL